MLAFKCDICGKLFEENKNGCVLVCRKYTFGNGELPEASNYALCPKCMDSISSLIQVLKPENYIINKERSE